MRELAASLLLIAACSAPASAAPKPDSSDEETRKMVYDYGLCVVKSRRAAAAEVILANTDNSTIIRGYPSLRSSECALKAARDAHFGGVRIRFPGDMFHYALADALVAVDLSAAIPRDLTAVAPLQHREVDESEFRPKAGKKVKRRRLEELEQARARAMAFSYFSRFGECVVRTDPGKAHALLMTRPTTAAEADAFAALASVFSSCLGGGKQFPVKRMIARGMIAVNYYRLAMAARNPVPGASR